MADLEFEKAKNLAGALVTIGHPFSQAAIEATAFDLIKWCKGALISSVRWSPERQAQWLVDEVRETWDEWPDKGGTKRLLALFRSKFAPQALQPGNAVVDWANEPCCCGRPLKFKDCCQGKPVEMDPITLPQPQAGALSNFTPLTEAQFQKALDDEQRRKAEQLRRLGLD